MKSLRCPRRGVPARAFAAAVAVLGGPLGCLLGCLPSGAEPAVRPAAVCAPAPGDAAVAVASVSGWGDVVLADGRALRLAGLDLPRTGPGAPDGPAGLLSALRAWAAGPVALHPLGAPDRWGRVPALLFRADEPAEAGVALLAAGLARAAPEPSTHACAASRLAAEDGARAARRGIWADPAYAVLAPDDATGLGAQAGGLAILRGVLRVHESRGALYLALGRGRRGFVAVVSRRDVKLFAKAGLDPRDYAGTPVRLRGDLDARFGPRMRLTDPDALESLEPGSVPDDAAAGGDR